MKRIIEFVDNCLYYLGHKADLKIVAFVTFFGMFFTWVACATLQTAFETAPVVLKTVQTISELVKERTGRELKEIPHSCEYEWTEDKHLLLLCDFDLNKNTK